jgi:hypothetical protein
MFLNYTSHAIDLILNDTTTTIQSSGLVRLDEVDSGSSVHEGVTIRKTSLGQASGLPAPVDGVFIIVSMVVANALRGVRSDLVYPDVLRDGAGKIIGCKGFIQPV